MARSPPAPAGHRGAGTQRGRAPPPAPHCCPRVAAAKLCAGWAVRCALPRREGRGRPAPGPAAAPGARPAPPSRGGAAAARHRGRRLGQLGGSPPPPAGSRHPPALRGVRAAGRGAAWLCAHSLASAAAPTPQLLRPWPPRAPQRAPQNALRSGSPSARCPQPTAPVRLSRLPHGSSGKRRSRTAPRSWPRPRAPSLRAERGGSAGTAADTRGEARGGESPRQGAGSSWSAGAAEPRALGNREDPRFRCQELHRLARLAAALSQVSPALVAQDGPDRASFLTAFPDPPPSLPS